MKKLIFAILCLAAAMPSRAEGDITVMDWSVLQIDTEQPPLYSETIPLAADYHDYSFSVKIEYPEWGTVTAAEADKLKRFDIPGTLEAQTHVGVMDGQGLLDVSFVPVVRTDKGLKKLLSCRITVLAERKKAKVAKSRADAGERYVSSSVLASGRWVKVAVTEDGVHRITKDQLANMGFTNPSQVRVFGYGGHLLPEALNPDELYDDLPEVPVMFDEAQTLYFWANGLVKYDNTTNVGVSMQRHTTNYCATQACYFLTDGSPKIVPNVASSASGVKQTISSALYTSLYEKDEFAWASIGRNLFDKASTSNGGTISCVLPTPNAVPGAMSNTFISFSGAPSATASVSAIVDGDRKSYIYLDAPGEYEKASVQSVAFKHAVTAGETKVQLKPSTSFEGHLDFVEMSYNRILSFGQETSFWPVVTGTTAFDIANTGDGTKVLWRIPEPGVEAARIMPAPNGTYVVEEPNHGFVAFRPSAVTRTVTAIGQIGNQNLHAPAPDVDMVIITPSSGIFDSEAQRLADAHAATDGLRCRVVKADQIYNEFSSGTPDVTAYRRYVKMLYERQATKPRYLLMFGDCAADNRMLTAQWRTCRPENFLLCYESENSVSDTGSFVSEDYLGMMDDGEGGMPLFDKADIAVGRFTVRTVADAKILVDKTIRHLQGDPGVWQNRVAFLGDDGDNNSHMDYANRVANAVEANAPDLEVRRIMWDAYKRESSAVTNTFPNCVSAIERMNKDGVLMMNYTGHGATYVLSHENVISLSTVKGWKNSHCPVWFTAACDVMPIDAFTDNVGRSAILNPNGGAVAFVGTARTVYAAQNYTLNSQFCRYLFATNSIGRRYSVGDALRMAKNASGVGSTENKLQFVLAGDPSLVFGNPPLKVVLDEINSVPAANYQLKAGSKAVMIGRVVDADGQTISDFEGNLSAHVLDSKATVVCNNAAKVSAGPFTFLDRNKTLFEGTGTVSGGKFEFSFIVPVDINYSDENGRVNFYATSGKRTANGHDDTFVVGGISDELAGDKTGPEIFVTLDRNDFPEGGTVSPTPYFMATLHDDCGINLGAGGIGHNLELSIDGRGATTYDVSNYFVADPGTFRSGQVAFPVPELAPGEHTLTFRAWDLLNNPASRTLSFVVDGSFTPDVNTVTISPNPASTYANIYIDHNCPGSDIEAEVNIYDYAGRLLQTLRHTGNEATPTVYVTWNLNTGAGVPLGAGVYIVRVRICRAGVWSECEAQKLFVFKQGRQ